MAKRPRKPNLGPLAPLSIHLAFRGPYKRYSSKPGQPKADADSYAIPTRLTHAQLKTLLTKSLTTNSAHDCGTNIKSSGTGGLMRNRLFKRISLTYYEGKFVDRLGQSIKKPQLSLTFPVAHHHRCGHHSRGVSVMIEYMVDLFDPTPAMGDAMTGRRGRPIPNS